MWTPDELSTIGAADGLQLAFDAGGVQHDVEYVDPGPSIGEQLDVEYRSKYGRYGPQYVGPMVTPGSRAATLKSVPRK